MNVKKIGVIFFVLSVLALIVVASIFYIKSQKEPNYRVTIVETKFDPVLKSFGTTFEYFLCQDFNVVVSQVYDTRPRTKEGSNRLYTKIRKATMIISFVSPDPRALKTRKSAHSLIVQLEEKGGNKEFLVQDLHTSTLVFYYKNDKITVFQ